MDNLKLLIVMELKVLPFLYDVRPWILPMDQQFFNKTMFSLPELIFKVQFNSNYYR